MSVLNWTENCFSKWCSLVCSARRFRLLNEILANHATQRQILMIDMREVRSFISSFSTIQKVFAARALCDVTTPSEMSIFKKKLFVVVFCWLCKRLHVALWKRSQAWGFTSSMCWRIPLHRDLHKKICLDKIIEYHLFIAEMKNSSDQVYLPFIKWETGIFLYCCGLMEGAAASHWKIFSGLQNWAQDQHIEYAWLSFHPSALIQYSQRLMQKKRKKKRLLGIDQDGCWGI